MPAPAAAPEVEPEPEPEPALEVNAQILALLQNLSGEVSSLKAKLTTTETQLAAVQTTQLSSQQAIIDSSTSFVQQLKGLAARLETVETAPAPSAVDTYVDPDDKKIFVPHYDGKQGPSPDGTTHINPCNPERGKGVTDKPQVYKIKVGDSDTVKELTDKKKTAALGEYNFLKCQSDYFWDVITYLKEWQSAFTTTNTTATFAQRKAAYEAILNSVEGLSKNTVRKLNLIELQCRAQSSNPNFVTSEADKALISIIESKVSGFSSTYGFESDIDPLIQQTVMAFADKTQTAAFSAAAKSAGAAATKPSPKAPAPPGKKPNNKPHKKAPAAPVTVT